MIVTCLGCLRMIPRRDADEEIDPARRLHGRRGHDDGQDDQEHFAGNAAGRGAESEDEDGQPDAAPEAHADAAGPRPDGDGREQHDELKYQDERHGVPRLYGAARPRAYWTLGQSAHRQRRGFQ